MEELEPEPYNVTISEVSSRQESSSNSSHAYVSAMNEAQIEEEANLSEELELDK